MEATYQDTYIIFCIYFGVIVELDLSYPMVRWSDSTLKLVKFLIHQIFSRMR